MKADAPATRRWSRAVGRAAHHAASLAVALLFLVPLAWVLAASLRQPGLPPPRTVEWLPQPVEWSNYRQIFELVPLARYTLNSLLVAGLAVPLTLVTASWAGFAMAQIGPRARAAVTALSLVLLMVPVTALWLPRFVLFKWAGLLNSYWSLLVPALAGSSPLFVLLYFWTFRRVPAELFEAARLDGAGALSVWRRIAFPLAGPTSVAVGILTFLAYWSDFIQPLLYLRSQELYTLPVGLQQLQQLDRTNWPLLMAASVVVIAPAVALFLVVQRYFLQETRLGGLAGS